MLQQSRAAQHEDHGDKDAGHCHGMAGTVSTNPVLLVAGIALILAWKNAGYWGLDRWLLPLLGTPWKVGTLVRQGDTGVSAKPTAT